MEIGKLFNKKENEKEKVLRLLIMEKRISNFIKVFNKFKKALNILKKQKNKFEIKDFIEFSKIWSGRISLYLLDKEEATLITIEKRKIIFYENQKRYNKVINKYDNWKIQNIELDLNQYTKKYLKISLIPIREIL
jgi:hypothetical protein